MASEKWCNCNHGAVAHTACRLCKCQTFDGKPDDAPATEGVKEVGQLSRSELSDKIMQEGNASIGLSMLKGVMKFHPDFAWTWHCNIACVAMDEGVNASTANLLAARFMMSAFEVDTAVKNGTSAKMKEWLGMRPDGSEPEKPDSGEEKGMADVRKCSYCDHLFVMHSKTGGGCHDDTGGICRHRCTIPYDLLVDTPATEGIVDGHDLAYEKWLRDNGRESSRQAIFDYISDVGMKTDGPKPPAAPALSLLIMDMTDQCIMRVERGKITAAMWPTFYSDADYQQLWDSGTFAVDKTFPNLKSQIDKDFAVEPPIPRLMKVKNSYQFTYSGPITQEWSKPMPVTTELFGMEYDALNTLAKQAGATQDLPIYDSQTASRGVWTRLPSIPEIAIWRFEVK